RAEVEVSLDGEGDLHPEDQRPARVEVDGAGRQRGRADRPGLALVLAGAAARAGLELAARARTPVGRPGVEDHPAAEGHATASELAPGLAARADVEGDPGRAGLDARKR